MKFEKGKVNFDFEEDVFSAVLANRKYDSSIQIDDLIFDLDKKGNISGVEILNASKILNTPKIFLKNNLSGNLLINVNEKSIRLKILVKFIVRNSERISSIDIEKIKPDFLASGQIQIAVA